MLSAATAIALVGAAVAVGWIVHMPVLIRLSPELVSMKFNTALCFVALGIATHLLVRGLRVAARAVCAVVLVIALLTGLEYLLGRNFGIDVLFIVPFQNELNVPAGRMSPITAFMFALSSGALVLSASRNSSRYSGVVASCASIIGGISLAAAIGYATRTPTAYAWGAVASVALHTALTFIVVALVLVTIAASSSEQDLPRWLPATALLAGLACTLALGMALYVEIGRTSDSLVPEVAIATGCSLSLLAWLALRSQSRLHEQRKLLGDAFSRQGTAGIIRDIAGRLATERLMQGVLEAAPDAMVITDDAGAIVLVNSMTESLFGYSREELIGASVERLVPERFRHGHVALRQGFLRSPGRRQMGQGRDLQARRRDGSEFPAEIALNHLALPHRLLILTAVRDASARQAARRRLQDSLAEKELLLKEVHHRVKNNLQVVASMLALQAEQLDEPRLREPLENCRKRVISMSLVHEKLYGAHDLRRIDLGELVREITTMLLIGDLGGRVRVCFDLQPVTVDIETAFPASLMVNELITNAMKHAFAGPSQGALEVIVRRVPHERVEIVIADDGPGGLTTASLHANTSLGSTIIRNFARQLDAHIYIQGESGCRVCVSFPSKPTANV